MDSEHERLYQQLEAHIPASRLIREPLRLVAYGNDASFYRLVPKLIARVENEQELVKALQLTSEHRLPVTFRAAGTSLSGQSITDSVLLALSGWQGCEINADASEIRLQPGVIGERANIRLAPFGRKIGPDPASINAAKIGGIAANNASGMCCGRAQNSYHTLAGMRIIFADGTLLDTRDPASRNAFEHSQNALLEQISALATRVKKTPALVERIRHKYRLKNTTGYSLNALVDFDDPIEIIQHLMIGSEGTLGFIAEITYRTVPEHPHKATALAIFPDIETACRAVEILKSTAVDAVELMDRASLRSVQSMPGMPDYLCKLPGDVTALLIDTRAPDAARLERQIAEIQTSLEPITKLRAVEFTEDPAEYAKLWNIRKGIFPAVGAVRETGTTVIIEDVAFPVPRLAEATRDLHRIFKQYGYDEAVIWGHALEGNMHFVVTQDFSTPPEVERYRQLIDAVCKLVVEKYEGSLKAEHSTGRNMAPYVDMEWGQDAYRLMREIKTIFDPQNLLNPGVITNDDPQVHLHDLKPLPAAHPIVDKCIECGFCEAVCPSRDLTFTPRQRIVALREIARLRAAGNNPQEVAALEKTYQYPGLDTCAACGMCATRCPVSIDIGKVTKALRAEQFGDRGRWVAQRVADNFGPLTSGVRAGLWFADRTHAALGSKRMGALTSGARRLSGGRIPLWNNYMPRPAQRITKLNGQPQGALEVVYFPSCAARTMGPARGDPEQDALHERTVALLHKAGYRVIFPQALERQCCGRPFESKGLPRQGEHMAKQLQRVLLAASDNGRIPVLCDTVPCVQALLEGLDERLNLYDPVQFLHRFLTPRLKLSKRAGTIALHITCSTRKLGLGGMLQELAEHCAERVVVPEGHECCGWAGDRGFTFPELNASALAGLRDQLPEDCEAGYCNSRTCEIGASLHSGIYYRSIVYLIDRCSQPLD
jgi:D-lactate dehydrogenase